ncbi:MAG: NAD(P)-binding protein [Chloroflexales bacterium]|nr:NAD(P)-binding protein [Chloroflexales bacterium]
MPLAELPILIVGAGPVGLSLALALARAGIRAQVFEALPELSAEARASTFHPPSLELFAAWGVVDQMLARGHRVERLLYWERATRQLVAAFDYAQIAADTPYPFRLQLPQSQLTRLLVPALEESGMVTLHMGHRLTELVDAGGHIEASFATPDGVGTVRGAYLCGADGSRSTVRKRLGLSFEGLTYPDRFLLVATDLGAAALFPGLGPVNYIFDPYEWVIILRLPDLLRVVFQVRPAEDEAMITRPELVRQRIERFLGAAVPISIKSCALYSTHQRVAETFRVGRALLLGDAAHINNPAGGMGMNSGIHDAHHLAEALRGVCAGGPDSLLDDYSQARQTIALERIKSYSDENYTALTLQDAAVRQVRNLALRAAAADPRQARAYLLRASMLEERI